MDGAGNVTMTLLVDSKQVNSKGLTLAKGAGGATQLTDDWIDAVMDKLPNVSPARDAIVAAQKNGTLIRAVAFVDKGDKTLNLVKVDIK